jgi:hypothetical protein
MEGSSSLVVYVWLDVCDITKRIHKGPNRRQRQIELQYSSIGEASAHILEQFHRLKKNCHHQQRLYKIPCNSSVLSKNLQFLLRPSPT